MEKLKNVDGCLIDLGGVVFVDDTLIHGAAGAIRALRNRQVPFRFITNTTTHSIKSLLDKLKRLGLEVQSEELFGVLQAAQALLREKGKRRYRFLVTDDPLTDFEEFEKDEVDPEVIVVGDYGKVWNYDLMNDLCRQVMAGAELVALHKGKYWQTSEGLRVDIGAFVAGIEYVTGVEAKVVGKPSAEFFRLASGSLGIEPGKLVMVGDDIESDLGGAQRAGLRGVLVKTGKYREELAAKSTVTPDAVIGSIAELPGLIR